MTALLDALLADPLETRFASLERDRERPFSARCSLFPARNGQTTSVRN